LAVIQSLVSKYNIPVKPPADINKLNLLTMRFCVLVLLLLLSSTVSFSQNISGVVNVYSKVLWADSAKGSVKLANVSGFGAYIGHKVMIIQMKGATIDETNTSTFGNITAIKEVGYYEIGTICGFVSDTMILERKFNNFYDVTGHVQCVIFPKYNTDVTVVDTLKAAVWDSTAGTGGVLAIDVPGTLFLNKPVSASGQGFRGGTYQQFAISCSFTLGVTDYYYPNTSSSNNNGGFKGEGIADFITAKEYGRGKQASGGGGGNNHNSGGGGGSNYGTGGQGGFRTVSACRSNTPGLGGLSLSSFGFAVSPTTQNRIFMGGGGGAGHDNDGTGMPGGHGGGIVYIVANRIEGSSATASDNKIMANGTKPSRYITLWGITSSDAGSDGAGGGGAGGTVILKVNSYGGNAITAEASGGSGGGTETFGQNQCSGPGGGGGGGAVWISQATTPAGLNINITVAPNGTTSATASCASSPNGATSGSPSFRVLNFALQAPRDSSPVCTQLVPLYLNASITGYQQGGSRYFTAMVSNKDNVQQCSLQKAFTVNDFSTMASQNSNNNEQYQFTDAGAADRAAIYRSRVVTKDGAIVYSPVLRMSSSGIDKKLSVDIYPNPSREKITVQVYAEKAESGVISILNAMGGILRQQPCSFAKGFNVIPLRLNDLPGGVLFVKVSTSGGNIVQPFVKLAD
jgi:hypothetical protein